MIRTILTLGLFIALLTGLAACQPAQPLVTLPAPATPAGTAFSVLLTPAAQAAGVEVPAATTEPPPPAEPPAAPTEAPPSPTTGPALTPAATAVPLAEQDALYQELTSKGYKVIQSGSFEAPDGFTYSVYLFRNLDILYNPDDWIDKLKEGHILAFYRWDGETNTLLGTRHGSIFSRQTPIYPSYYRLANWDDPYLSMFGISSVENPDAETRQLLNLDGYTADINQNGRPEFVVASEYCPVSCTYPTYGFDFFEIDERGKIVELSASLPGRIQLYPVSADPLVFEARDARSLEASSVIQTPYLVSWQPIKGFVDVTSQFPDLLTQRAEALRQELEASYAQPAQAGAIEAKAYNLLMLYQQMGQREAGVQAFLQVTDPANWASAGPAEKCWLQISRAAVQQQQAQNLPFTAVPGVEALFPRETAGQFSSGPSPEALQLLQSLDPSLYDLSACTGL